MSDEAPLASVLLTPLALHLWGRVVARRQGGGVWSFAAWLPFGAFGVGAVKAAAALFCAGSAVLFAVGSLRPPRPKSAAQLPPR